MRVKFTKFDTSTNWVQGKIGKYDFEAKLYDNGSEFGINKGRVSKLTIYDKNKNWLVNYDRSWDIEPRDEIEDGIEDVYANLMETLETVPKRFS